MALGDRIIAAISGIHAAGFDAAEWPQALSLVTELIGGHGASLEFMERPSLHHRRMYAHGLPDVGAYMEYYAPLSPRYPHLARQPAGSVQYDGLYYDDAAMDADPFYAEFLAQFDMRYFLGGSIAKSPRELAAFAVQISPRQGHPTPAKIELMGLLLPHIQQAADVMRRLNNLSNLQRSFEDILNWLADGVLKLAADGSVRYANLAAQEIFRRNDEIATRRGAVEFLSSKARAKFGVTLQAAAELRDARVSTLMNADFIAETRSGAPPFSISIRPVLTANDESDDIVALMFIHDPLTRDTAVLELLQQAFGLTPAEADVARGLRSGLSADTYARERQVSPNTVYTHIRRIKGKVGCTRMTELIRKLNDMQVAVVHKRDL